MKTAEIDEIIKRLAALENPENIAGMRRFGIVAKKAFGIAAPELKQIAIGIKKTAENRHELALELWESEIHEARILAYLIDDLTKVTPEQMDAWAADFDNWAICDGTCGHLFRKTAFAYEKAFEWSEHEGEFIKRAGIVLMACLAIHDTQTDDREIAGFLPVLEKHSNDERNFVKKAVNWALRQIGKRNLNLHKLAVEAAERIRGRDTRAARWIAADALRELSSEKIVKRLQEKSKRNAA